MAKVRVEFSGDIELDAQGWADGCDYEQIKKQARDTINHWTIMIKKGGQEPMATNLIKAKVTHVILEV